MKRMIAVVCAALCLTAALSACGKKEEAQIDLQKVYEAILDAQGDKKDDLVMLEEPEDSGYLDTFYPGLRDIARKQTVVELAPVSGFATEVVMVEVENSGDAAAVEKIFNDRIKTAQEDTIYPDTAVQWQRAQVQTHGNYVAMVVLSDEFNIPEDVFSLVK